jgi:hypothetical protein
LVLLAERGDFLKPVILRIWESPDDPTLVPILHRMLLYYGRMVVERREADRNFKSKRGGVHGDAMLGQEVHLANDPPEMPKVVGAPYRDLAEQVREYHQLTCQCDWGEYECYIEVPDSDRSCLKFSYRCGCSRMLGPVTLTSADLAQIARLAADSN